MKNFALLPSTAISLFLVFSFVPLSFADGGSLDSPASSIKTYSQETHARMDISGTLQYGKTHSGALTVNIIGENGVQYQVFNIPQWKAFMKPGSKVTLSGYTVIDARSGKVFGIRADGPNGEKSSVNNGVSPSTLSKSGSNFFFFLSLLMGGGFVVFSALRKRFFQN